METLAFLFSFVLLGVATIFVAFSGGPAAARDAYLTRGHRGFRIAIPLIYLAFGVAVPVAVIAGREEAEGGVGALEQGSLASTEERGKQLFKQTCSSCHNLDAVNARGVTGPDLDEVGPITDARILAAIRSGGTGQKHMPANLLQGSEARDVARYLSRVAGR